jgi:hypothetical protein
MIYRDQHILRDRGELVWGQIVQANSILFDRSNTRPLPACGVYSTDPYFDDHVDSWNTPTSYRTRDRPGPCFVGFAGDHQRKGGCTRSGSKITLWKRDVYYTTFTTPDTCQATWPRYPSDLLSGPAMILPAFLVADAARKWAKTDWSTEAWCLNSFC